MREYKFKGKRKNDGEWVYGCYLKRWTGIGYKHFIHDGLWEHEVDPETVGQYTGSSDKTGKEIYEDDIIKHEEGLNRIVFINGLYIAECILSYDWQANEDYTLDDIKDYCEVVGNIWDNPELLKEGSV